MIIGAEARLTRASFNTSESLYRTFKMKRVYYSAYVPVVDSPMLPTVEDGAATGPGTSDLSGRLASAVLWIFCKRTVYGEITEPRDPDLDPKVMRALRNPDQFLCGSQPGFL